MLHNSKSKKLNMASKKSSTSASNTEPKSERLVLAICN